MALTSGHTVSLQLFIRRLIVAQMSYNIAMKWCVHCVGGIS